MIKTAQSTKGFTLIELLVVIGIIGILAAVIVLAINPAEIQRRGRDATRISDMANIRKGLDLAIVDGGVLSGSTATPYVSDSAGTTTANLATNYVGMDVSRYLSVLPTDPSRIGTLTDTVAISDGTQGGTTTSTRELMRYEYTSDGANYEVNCRMESTDNWNKLSNDGGTDAGWYELGTDPGLNLI